MALKPKEEIGMEVPVAEKFWEHVASLFSSQL